MESNSEINQKIENFKTEITQIRKVFVSFTFFVAFSLFSFPLGYLLFSLHFSPFLFSPTALFDDSHHRKRNLKPLHQSLEKPGVPMTAVVVCTQSQSTHVGNFESLFHHHIPPATRQCLRLFRTISQIRPV